jgi:hypothetical protein
MDLSARAKATGRAIGLAYLVELLACASTAARFI